MMRSKGSLPVRLWLAVLSSVLAGPVVAGNAAPAALAPLVDASGVREGLLVLVGGSLFDAEEAVGLSRRFVVHCLDADPQRVLKNRQTIQAKGVYGQVIVEHWTAGELPYLDNLVSLLVADGKTAPAAEEALRVLRPGGKLCIMSDAGPRTQAKPWPDGMGQWTHQWNQAHGNLLSDDRLADVPTGIQWLMAPTVTLSGHRFAATQAMITAGGRVFFVTINDEENLASGTASNFLIARDAFNGLFLWKRPWQASAAVHAKSDAEITAVSCPRIVADKDRLYITEGNEALALDAASGQVVQRYPCEGAPQALLFAEGKLVIESDKGLAVMDPASGKRLWFHKTRGVPNETKAARPRQQWRLETPGIISTMVSHGKACFLERCRNQDGKGQHDEAVCLDFETGRELWRKDLRDVTLMSALRSIKICFLREKVLGLVDENVFSVLSTADGRELWSQRSRASSKWWTYHRFVGHFFKDDQVWLRMVDTEYQRDFQEVWNVYEAESGKLVREFKSRGLWPRCENPGKEGCLPIIATDRHIIYPRQVTFIDFKTGQKHNNTFFRGTCVLGSIPANGMHYVAPEACACFTEIVRGFMAVGSRPGIELLGPGKPEERLVKGPAWKSAAAAPPAAESAWPQYRSDAARGASAACDLPADLAELWAVPLAGPAACRSRVEWSMRPGGALTAPVAAGGKVFLAVPDSHQVQALDAATGAKLWQFTADGRIDTPPAVFQGLCLFGAHDGRVYCLRAADGELVWRFLAAPNERRMIAFGQPASPWPVGSVLVHGGLVFAAAGRALEADGGVFLSALEPATGKCLWRKNLKEGVGLQCDVLTSDEKSLYLLGQEVNPLTGEVKAGADRKRFLTTSHYGLTDATWTRNDLARRKNMQTWRHGDAAGFMLAFSRSGAATYPGRPNEVRFAPAAGAGTAWKQALSGAMQVEALALASETLLAAGPMDWQRVKEKRGFLRSYSVKDGKKLTALELPAPPVYDGLAAAYGRVYVATADGALRCFGEKK